MQRPIWNDLWLNVAIGRLCEKCDGKWYVERYDIPVESSFYPSVPYVIPTLDRKRWSEYAMNVISVPTEDVV
jgi:hypothetical protein